MSDLVMGSDLNAMVEAYLDELARALSRLPTSRRDHLVGEIREHIVELRSERPPRDRSDMESLLNRVGLPEDIAAVALEDMDDVTAVTMAAPSAPATAVMPAPAAAPTGRGLGRFSHRMVAGVAAAVVVSVIVVAGVAGISRSGSRAVTAVVQGSPLPPLERIQVAPFKPPFSVSPIPDLIGDSEAQAEAILHKIGRGYTVRTVASPNMPAGTVVSQSPASGVSWPARLKVDLLVSSGAATATS